jgi:hypothetical protein
MRFGQIKNGLKLGTVKALITVKTRFKNVSCSEYFSHTPKEEVFLEQVRKSDKYSGESGKDSEE